MIDPVAVTVVYTLETGAEEGGCDGGREESAMGLGRTTQKRER
jgi:hypothetical protein